VPGDLTKRWVAPIIYGVLGLELAVVTGFAAAYNALDFRIYMWGGHAVTHDTRLYLDLAYGHWFTYSPFAAVVFVPIAALPLAVARIGWDLASVAALGYSLVLILKLAGYRPSRLAIAGATAAAMALDPVYQTLFLGQINLILLALILTDVWRVANGRNAGLGVGIGVGVAAAVKLTPAIFIVFFLLAGKVKPAVIAAATFLGCGLIGLIVAPGASKQYWEHLCYDTSRVGAPYISNQSPYAAAIRIAGGAAHVGAWYVVIPLALAAAGLAAATILARHGDWLGAATVTGSTGLLVSPISWAHHWVWILPALVVLVRSGDRVMAGLGYLLFAVAPFWYTPHSGGPREYGFHWLVTLAANCYLIAGLAFLAYMARRAYLRMTAAPPPPGPAGQGDEASLTGVRAQPGFGADDRAAGRGGGPARLLRRGGPGARAGGPGSGSRSARR
jgi:alpha-1,2-mannosyltransferase